MKSILIAAALLGAATAAQAGGLLDFFSQQTRGVQPLIVLGPMAKVNIGGPAGERIVAVIGDDRCPDLPGQEGCIILNKPAVTVHYAQGGKAVTEQWAVKKDGDRTWLIRPDGTPVARAN